MEAAELHSTSVCSRGALLAGRPAARAEAATGQAAVEAQLAEAVKYVTETGCSPAEAIVLNRFDLHSARIVRRLLRGPAAREASGSGGAAPLSPRFSKLVCSCSARCGLERSGRLNACTSRASLMQPLGSRLRRRRI